VGYIEFALFVGLQLDRVWGRGDGAILQPKFTGIGVFVAEVAAPYVRLLGVYKHSFGAAEGSKGGVGVALGLYDVTMAFVNCHMASKKTFARRQQYMDLVDRLGAKLGGRGFQLNEEFHAVVWMGDMNYHNVDISGKDALALIRQGKCRQLLLEHDELLKERTANQVRVGF
jgi:inositol polyphosphate 5-phosphatase INPP5B/F